MKTVTVTVNKKTLSEVYNQVRMCNDLGFPNFQKGEPINNLMKEITQELSTVKIDTDEKGIMIKADTLGSLEALISIMKEKGIPIKSADVGDVSRRDVIDASIMAKMEPEYGAILAFNVKMKEDAEEFYFYETVRDTFCL